MQSNPLVLNSKQESVRRTKAREKLLNLRKEIWPDLQGNAIWDRQVHRGFTTIPRTLPIVMNIIDSLSNGKPAGFVYFVLWCWSFDDPLIIIDNPQSFASESGFTGERALSTWKQRMKTLKSLGFIDSKDGASGEFHYVLVFNPHTIARNLKERIQQHRYIELLDRASQIGAKDMTSDSPA
jgi:hypothetical protein